MDIRSSSPRVEPPEVQQRLLVELLVLLQVLVLVGLVVLFAQINGVPDLTAGRIVTDDRGSYADQLVGPMSTNLTDLRAKVAGMGAQIDAICAAVASAVPAAFSPNPCRAP